MGDAEGLVLRRLGAVQQLDHAAGDQEVDDIRLRRRDEALVDDLRAHQALVEGERFFQILDDDAEVVEFVDHDEMSPVCFMMPDQPSARGTRRPSSADT